MLRTRWRTLTVGSGSSSSGAGADPVGGLAPPTGGAGGPGVTAGAGADGTDAHGTTGGGRAILLENDVPALGSIPMLSISCVACDRGPGLAPSSGTHAGVTPKA